MSEFKRYSEIKSSSSRSFGILFSIVFLIIYTYLFFLYEINLPFLVVISLLLCATAFLYPNILDYPNKIWLKFGLLIGSIISPLVMIIIYIISILPMSLYFKIFKKDLLNIKIDKEIDSYWVRRKKPLGSLRNQF